MNTVQGGDRIRKGWGVNFFQTPNQIYDMKVSGYAKAVYVYLCRCADDAKQCYPSYTTMAKALGFSRSTVRRAVTELIEVGLLLAENRRRDGGEGEYTSNLYTLIHPEDATQTDKDEVGSDRTYSGALEHGRVHQSTPMVSETRPKVHETTGGLTQNSEEYSIKRLNNESHDNNTQTPVVVEDVSRSLENILQVSVRTLQNLPAWIDTYGTEYLLEKAQLVKTDPPVGGWRNLLGAFHTAVEQGWHTQVQPPTTSSDPRYAAFYELFPELKNHELGKPLMLSHATRRNPWEHDEDEIRAMGGQLL